MQTSELQVGDRVRLSGPWGGGGVVGTVTQRGVTFTTNGKDDYEPDAVMVETDTPVDGLSKLWCLGEFGERLQRANSDGDGLD